MEDVTLEMGLELSPAAKEPSLRAAPGRGPRRGLILVMDDDRLVRKMLRRQLAVFGFEVETFADGREAVEAHVRARDGGRPFDVVILYLMVDGGWGGERALAELKKVDPGVKAMVCSGSLARPAASYGEQGFSAVLCKPCSLEDLRRRLEEMLV